MFFLQSRYQAIQSVTAHDKTPIFEILWNFALFSAANKQFVGFGVQTGIAVKVGVSHTLLRYVKIYRISRYSLWKGLM